MKATLVVTTIGDGACVTHYARQLRDVDGVDMIVIPDRKTPASLYEACAVARRGGFLVRCLTLDEQAAYLADKDPIARMIPFNSDNRRNIGFLMAMEDGCDFMISLDDDNFCLDGAEFIQEHATVCDSVTGTLVESPSGWVNICDLLTKAPERPIFPRGFPYKYRTAAPVELSFTSTSGRIAANAGLWFGDPDVDAVTRLAERITVTGFKGESWLLGNRAWTPINTQNTSIRYDAIPAYYYIRMGYPLGGIPIDRYGDILSGYFLQACAHHLGDTLRVGTPMADHRRNSHNLFKDLANELWCMWMLEDLVDWLTDVKLEGRTYLQTYLSLADALEEFGVLVSGEVWTDAVRGFVFQTAACMRAWGKTCAALGLS